MDQEYSAGFKMTGRTIELLTRALDGRNSKRRVIAGNMANIDTPGNQLKELRFDEALQKELGKKSLNLKTTNPAHLPLPSNLNRNGFTLVTRKTVPVDSDQTNLDHEMARMMKNNLLYEASARLMAEKIQALKTVISQGRS